MGARGKKWDKVERRIWIRRSPYIREVEHMFLGQYDHTIDEKGRLTIPARYRELLENGAYVTRGLDQNIMVYPAALFEQISKKVTEKSFTDPRARELRRLIFAHAERVDVDRVGRILIPQFLRDCLQPDGATTIVGAGEYFEIWSQQGWTEKSADLLEAGANQDRFAGLDISIG